MAIKDSSGRETPKDLNQNCGRGVSWDLSGRKRRTPQDDRVLRSLN